MTDSNVFDIALIEGRISDLRAASWDKHQHSLEWLFSDGPDTARADVCALRNSTASSGQAGGGCYGSVDG